MDVRPDQPHEIVVLEQAQRRRHRTVVPLFELVDEHLERDDDRTPGIVPGDHREEIERAGHEFRLRVGAVEEEALRVVVAPEVNQDAARGIAIATGAAGLLIVRLERPRHVVVEHEADVGLVDAHPERVRRDQHVDLSGHEAILHVGAHALVEPGVIRIDASTVVGQRVGDFFDRTAARSVDEPRPLGVVDDVTRDVDLLPLRAGGDDLERQVRTIETGQDLTRRFEPKLLCNVRPHGRCRRRGEGRDGEPAQSLDHRTQAPVVRAKVVTPLADAVRFVDDEAAGREPLDERDELAATKPLRRDEQHLQAARLEVVGDRPLVGRGEPGMDGRRGDPLRLQLIDLILHQGDQRAHDERVALVEQRRQLVAERLPCAGGHDHEQVFAGDARFDRLPLSLAEAVEPEAFPQQLLRPLHSALPDSFVAARSSLTVPGEDNRARRISRRSSPAARSL